MSLGSIDSVVALRFDCKELGDVERGSRDKRFKRRSSSYGTSISTIVGVLPLPEFWSSASLERHDPPE